ncbi:MAG: STAS domain-containing protein [Rickettsiales bacterium]
MQSPKNAPNQNSNDTVSFPASSDLSAAQELCNTLNNHLAASNEIVVLDASQIERISTAGIQLLLSMQKTCAETRRQLNIISNSVTDDGISDLGLPALQPSTQED